jgi:hypothetical protein
LRAFEDDFHRAREHARGHRGEHRVRPDRSFGAKSTADEFRNDPHVGKRQSENLRKAFACGKDALRRFVDREERPIPFGQRRVRFERIVMFHRRGIHRIDLYRRCRESRLRVTADEFGFVILVDRNMLARIHRGNGLLCCVLHTQHGGAFRRGFERIGEHDGDRFAIVENSIVLQHAHRAFHTASAFGLHARSICVGDNLDDARNGASRRLIDARDASLRDGGENQDAVYHAVRRHVARIVCRAGNLAHAVDPVDRCPDERAHAATVCSARTTARCTSSILKSFSP